MSIPTLPQLNGPRTRGFARQPHIAHASENTPSITAAIARSKPFRSRNCTRPARPSAYTVPGRARDFHPHSLKHARSSPTPASCPTQPSLPITPKFYHDSHAHAQKRPRMWHSSAASNSTAVDIFHFPRPKSRQCRHFRELRDTAPEKSQTCHIRAPFYTKVLISWRPTASTQEASPQRTASNNVPPKRPL